MVVHSRMTTCDKLLGRISVLVRSKILTLIETVFQYFYSIFNISILQFLKIAVYIAQCPFAYNKWPCNMVICLTTTQHLS